jgi:RNA polymerase sigma factor (sigma-70 family)
MPDTAEDLVSTRWTLIARLKDLDDQESWRQFFDSYWRLIYGVAIKSGLSHAEAQDVVQETVVSVSKNMKTFRADPSFGSFKGWLLNLTRWRITDQVRRRGREARLPAGDNPATTGSSRPEERLPDSEAAFEKIWEQEWEHHVIERALEKVKLEADARHYQVFYLNAIKQVPAARVAELLNINVDQVYLIKHRLTKIFEEGVKSVETPPA